MFIKMDSHIRQEEDEFLHSQKMLAIPSVRMEGGSVGKNMLKYLVLLMSIFLGALALCHA